MIVITVPSGVSSGITNEPVNDCVTPFMLYVSSAVGVSKRLALLGFVTIAVALIGFPAMSAAGVAFTTTVGVAGVTFTITVLVIVCVSAL